MPYPTELMPTVNGVTSYAFPAPTPLGPTPSGEEAAAYAAWLADKAAFEAAQLKGSPVDKIVGAFDALKGHVADLDEAGLNVLASCAQQIMLNGFHQKGEEALTVRDAAVAALSA
jgi:hypothetical protein